MHNASRLGTLIVLLLVAVQGFASKASGTFSVSTDIREAYNLVFQLRLEEAAASVDAIQKVAPDNLMAHYVADFVDFFTVFIDDDIARYQAIKSDRELRMRLVTLGDVGSPYYLFVQAEMYMHRALLRMKFGENFAAAADLNQAFKLLKRNQKRFPDFKPNLKSLGLLKAAFGTIPDHYRWAIELLSSMEGTVHEGMIDIKTALLDKQQLTLKETQYTYLLALMYFENAPEKALEFARNNGIRATNGQLDCFLLSHIALKSGQNDLALEWLASPPKTSKTYRIPYLDLMYGTAKLHRLDEDADQPLLKFLEEYKGKSYRKEALQKLGWHALIFDGEEIYQRYMTQLRSAGCEINEADRYAMSEACTARVPDAGLLKARLLFDGGYYLNALAEIEKVNFDNLSGVGQLEYQYRSGRIYQELSREYDALFAYKMTISGGSTSREYFACAAAFHAGELYEHKGDQENASYYYQMCLQMQPGQYQAGLHQKAKSGLSRLKGSGE